MLLYLLLIHFYIYTNYINILNFLIFTILIIFYKNYFFNNYVNIISHVCFIYFLLYVKYNWAQLYFNSSNYNNFYNNFLVNSDYLLCDNNINYLYNYISTFVFDLNNFYFINNKNDFFFLKEVYVNNIIVQNNSYSYYNFDHLILLLFYNINILFYLIFIFAIII